MRAVYLLLCFKSIFVVTTVNAFPLVTEDTGTRGTGKAKFELNAESSEKRDENVREDTFETELGVSYGLAQNLDVATALVYKDERVHAALNETRHVEGIGDSKISMKWRLYLSDVHSIGIKAGLYLPTGDEAKGLGTSTTNPFVNLVYSRESKNIEWDFDLGYRRNQGHGDRRESLWHLSSAMVWRVAEDWKVGAEIGTDSSRDIAQNRSISFATLASSFYVTKQFRMDAGLRMTDIPAGQLRTWLFGINHVF